MSPIAREEIIGRPLTLWLAPAGEAFPAIGDTPGGGWVLIGKAGDQNYTDDGVTLNLSQSIEEFTPAGSTMPVKAFRTDEAVEIGVTVADVRSEILQTVLNDNDIAESTGIREVSLLRGLDIAEYALLARGQSPYEDDGTGQFQVPRCYQSAEPEITWNKGVPATVELTFRSLRPDAADDDDMKVIYTDASIV